MDEYANTSLCDHYTVTVGPARITRLPLGRAEGRTWMTFVFQDPTFLHDGWRLGNYVQLSLDSDNSPVKERVTGGGEDGGVCVMQLAGTNGELRVRYENDGVTVAQEVFDLSW